MKYVNENISTFSTVSSILVFIFLVRFPITGICDGQGKWLTAVSAYMKTLTFKNNNCSVYYPPNTHTRTHARTHAHKTKQETTTNFDMNKQKLPTALSTLWESLSPSPPPPRPPPPTPHPRRHALPFSFLSSFLFFFIQRRWRTQQIVPL